MRKKNVANFARDNSQIILLAEYLANNAF